MDYGSLANMDASDIGLGILHIVSSHVLLWLDVTIGPLTLQTETAAGK
jgi:hypothetical protein